MNNSLNIDRIAFIGRTYHEYVRMFNIHELMLGQGCVLDCAVFNKGKENDPTMQ